MKNQDNRSVQDQTNNQLDKPVNEIERLIRLNLNGIIYEASIASQRSFLKVESSGVEPQILTVDDAQKLQQFLSDFQREDKRIVNHHTQDDNFDNSLKLEEEPNHVRGAVKNTETDGRLKGNEAFRPNDPDRSHQNGASKNGMSNRVNTH